jgi:hypothetical protein
MDPDANLREQRELLRDIRRLDACPAPSAVAEAARVDQLERLADLAEAMDDWLSRGGHLPAAWRAERR